MSMSRQAGIIRPGYNPLLVANAPTIGTATAGTSNCASVAFTAPSCTGGSVITTYTAYCTTTGTNSATGASSPITVTGLTPGTAYTFRVIATNIYGPSYPSAASNSVTPLAIGQQAYVTPGTFSWIAPAGVTSVSVVAVGAGGREGGSGGGGGGLGYKNNISVTPGNSYTVFVGATNPSPTAADNSFFCSVSVVRGGGGGAGSSISSGGSGGTFTGDGGGNGGSGGRSYATYGGGGGGGAGGYSGNGGSGGAGGAGPCCGGSNGSAGSGGAAGGGGGGAIFNINVWGGAGGGVGILGQGSSGAAGSAGAGGARGGNGSGGTSDGTNRNGGLYGGGGSPQGGGSPGTGTGLGGSGAVRIIWPGTTRQFPSTNTGNL